MTSSCSFAPCPRMAPTRGSFERKKRRNAMDFWKRRTTPTKATLTKDDDVAGREGEEKEKDETEEKTRRRNVLVASTTCVVTVGAGALRAAGAKAQEPANVYDFTVQQYGKMVSLGKYRGKVTAIVNVASE